MKHVMVFLFLVFGCSAFAGITVSSGDVVPGVWHGNFHQVTNAAYMAKRPMVLVWTNEGCGHCDTFKDALGSDQSFKDWQSASGYLFCLVQGARNKDPQESVGAREFAKTAGGTLDKGITGYPYVCLYWVKPSGEIAAKSFSGETPAGLMEEASGVFSGFVSDVEYGFLVQDTERDRYEAEPGMTPYVDVFVTRSFDDGNSGPFTLEYRYPVDGSVQREDFSWNAGEISKTFRIAIPENYGPETIGLRIETAVFNGAAERLATGGITFVSKENGPTNPYFIGEKPLLEAGDWSMDLDAVTNAVAEGRADHAFVYFTGALWCPHCQGLDEDILSTSTFRNWALEKRIVFAVMDNPRRSSDENPLVPNGNPPSLLRYEAGVNNYLGGIKVSGAGYMSRKAIPIGSASTVNTAEYVLQRNHTLGYPGGYFCAPGATRTGYPTIIALNSDFTIAGRFVGHESEGYRYDLEENMGRMADLLNLIDGTGESDNFSETTTRTIVSGSSENVCFQINDASEFFMVDVKEGYTRFSVTNATSATPVVLTVFCNGKSLASSLNSVLARLTASQIAQGVVLEARAYPDSSVFCCSDGMTSAFEASVTAESIQGEGDGLVDGPGRGDSLPGFGWEDYSLVLWTKVEAGKSFNLVNVNGAKKIYVKKESGKLPSGLKMKYDEETSRIVMTGRPRKPGVYEVEYYISAMMPDGRRIGAPSTFRIVVSDPGAVNAYIGNRKKQEIPLIAKYGEKNVIAGKLSVSISSAGKISAKYEGAEKKKYTFSGYWSGIDGNTGEATALLEKSGAALQATLDVAGQLSVSMRLPQDIGVFGDEYAGSANPPKSGAYEDFGGYYTVTLPSVDGSSGTGYITLAMTSAGNRKKGKMQYKGMLADGTKISGTAMLLTDSAKSGYALLPVIKRSSKYMFSALLSIRCGASATWNSADDVSKLQVIRSADGVSAVHFTTASSVLSLMDAWGGYYVKNIAPAELADTFGLGREFDLKIGGQRMTQLIAEEKTFDYGDGDRSLRFKFTKSTGVFYGKATMSLLENKEVSGKFYGILLPGWTDCGCGDEVVVRPFGSGTFYWKERVNGATVIRSLPVDINAIELE